MRGGATFPVRLRYAKRGKVRFTSHRDVARAFERAFRIARLPLAFSAGFSPHPKVSFGLALPTGAESDAEFLDLDLTVPFAVETLPALLTEALPEGITVTAAAALEDRAPALMEVVTACEWRVTIAREGSPLHAEEMERMIEAALAREALPVARTRKGRATVDDVRPVIRRFLVQGDDADGVVAVLEVATRPRGAKPADVLAAVADATGAGDLVLVRALRTTQWIERDGARREPLPAGTRVRSATRARDGQEGTDVTARDPRDRSASIAGAGALPAPA